MRQGQAHPCEHGVLRQPLASASAPFGYSLVPGRGGHPIRYPTSNFPSHLTDAPHRDLPRHAATAEVGIRFRPNTSIRQSPYLSFRLAEAFYICSHVGVRFDELEGFFPGKTLPGRERTSVGNEAELALQMMPHADNDTILTSETRNILYVERQVILFEPSTPKVGRSGVVGTVRLCSAYITTIHAPEERIQQDSGCCNGLDLLGIVKTRS
jgi:hypothetical protein